MRLLVLLSLALSLTTLAGRCGTTSADGECQEYKPLAMCSEEFEYVCETTDDGCEQCSCVPMRHIRDAPGHGPRGPLR